MLHLTNGDATVALLERSGLGGDVFAWSDVLHEGPVPAELSLDELSDVRARHLAVAFGQPYETVRREFAERDERLRQFGDYAEVCLWFEHDLYDQLQLIQVLDWLSTQTLGRTQFTLVNIGEHPDVSRFRGLGELTPAQLAALFPQRQAVLDGMFEAARLVWGAFRQPEPVALRDALYDDIAALPFLRPAMMRLLEEYPGVRDGTSRTERQVLRALYDGPLPAAQAFSRVAEMEEAAFLGDAWFFRGLDALTSAPHPLLEIRDARYGLVATGHAVLAGDADHVGLNGIDRWLGGTHLRSDGPDWRWDPQRRTVELHNRPAVLS